MTNKDLNLANSALRLVVAYDDLMRRYTGPVSDLTGADNAAIDEAYDQMVAAARITLDVTARTTPPAPQEHVEGSSDHEDAERFRALMRCGRIKMQGSVGVDPKTGQRNGNNVHFGAEFWPEPIPAGFEEDYEASTVWGRHCIRALADAILEDEARRAALASEGSAL